MCMRIVSASMLLVIFVYQSEVLADEIRLASRPSRATIFVNGKDTKRVTPAKLNLKAEDRITLKLKGHVDWETKLADDTKRVYARLEMKSTFRMLLMVKTANSKNAGTDDLTVALLLNGDKKYRRVLDRRSYDDRRVGAVDKYELEFDCPISRLKGFRIVVEDGDDAWICDAVAAQMLMDDGLATRHYAFVDFVLFLSSAA